MSLITLKIIFALVIFLITIIAGLWPLHLAQKQKDILSLGNIFAHGVFLSAALIHLLPEAGKAFGALWQNSNYPIASLICIITYTLLFSLERWATSNHKFKHFSSTLTTPIILVIVLTIHSLSEGSAIGINASISGTIIIFAAVIAHKSSESIALAANLHHYTLSIKTITKIIIAFALTTPIGILISAFIQHVTFTSIGELLAGIFNAIAAGTFLYLGTAHIIADPSHCKVESYTFIPGICAFLLGIFLMSIVAIWI
jgi:solute carrier family 39 (zinc transporter), member 1/2/3